MPGQSHYHRNITLLFYGGVICGILLMTGLGVYLDAPEVNPLWAIRTWKFMGLFSAAILFAFPFLYMLVIDPPSVEFIRQAATRIRRSYVKSRMRVVR